MQRKRVCHLVPRDEWEKALVDGIYRPSSLVTEGFVHCSEPEQLIESAKVHFSEYDELVVLYFIPKHLGAKLKYEKGRNGELFPHIYSPIWLEFVETTKMLVRMKDGSYEIV